MTTATKRHHIIGDERPDAEALQQMRERGGHWFVYQNHDLGSAGVGELRFLKCGDGCTFAEPPARHPDTNDVIGWRYILVGEVNLKTGGIE